MLTIQAPTSCPSCSSTLEWINHILYCKSPSCGAQMNKKIEHFAKTLKIKGLGPVAISKLHIDSVGELYILELGDIIECLNSEALGSKLFAELQRSKNAPLNVLLPSFSIPLIGKTATEKLAKVCKNIHDIDRHSCDKAGLGPKATESLMNWMVDEFPFMVEMPFSFQFDTPKVSVSTATVCISGKLNSFKTKAIATEALQRAGFSVKATLTKEVQYLVNESGIESAKTKKARDSGVQIITNLKDFIGE